MALTGEQKLREKIEELEFRIEELERVLGQNVDTPDDIHLTASERRIVGILLSVRGYATRDKIIDVLYGARPDVDWPDPHVLSTFLSHLRKKLREWCERRKIKPPIVIVGVWGQGWKFSDEDKRRMAAAGFSL